jgi:hypothetical protein
VNHSLYVPTHEGDDEMTTYRGRVIGQDPVKPSKRTVQVTIELEEGDVPRMLSTVEVRSATDDKDIGRVLREILTGRSPGMTDDEQRRSIRNLVEEIEENCGWPNLAELIREVSWR